MPVAPEQDLDPLRLSLLKAKLGKLFDWKQPKVEKTVGPYDPTVFERFDEKRREIFALCEARIREYNDPEVRILHDRYAEDSHDIRIHWRRFLGDIVSQILNEMPPWYAGGFGCPEFAADFEYWCKMSYFSIPEVVCLSIGVDPGRFDSLSILDTRKRPDKGPPWESVKFFLDRYELIYRTFSGGNEKRRVYAKELSVWIKKVELPSPPEFTRLLNRYHNPEEAPQPQSDKVIRTDMREVDTLAKLLTAIAVREYGYKPDAKRSPVPKEIAEIAASLGLNVSDDTVRKYLKLGAQFLPKSWEPE